jgi:hypothetical protein
MPLGTFLGLDGDPSAVDTSHVPRPSHRRRKNGTRASTGPAVTEAIANIHLVAVDIRRRDGRRERKKDKVHG